MRLYALLLFLHVLASIVWVGGMFVMHFAVRPAAIEVLPPPQRLPLMAAALRRFFGWVTVSVLTILVSGLLMFVAVGVAAGSMATGRNAFLEGLRLAHPSIHAMFVLGLLMSAVYAYIRVVPFVRLRTSVAAQDWPTAATQLGRIRVLVATNLAIGVVVVGTATLGRAFG